MAKDRRANTFVENIVSITDSRGMKLLYPDYIKSTQGLLPETRRVGPVDGQSVSKPGQPEVPTFKAALLARLPKNFDTLHFVLNCLKAIGQAPFGCTGKQQKRYFFIWPSFDTGCCLLVALLVTFMIFVQVSHLLFNNFCIFPSGIRYTITYLENFLMKESGLKENTAAVHVLSFTFLNAAVAITMLLNVLCGWLQRHTLVNLMNDWTVLRLTARKLLKSGNPTTETATYYVVTLLGALAGLTTICFVIVLIWSKTMPHPDRVLESTVLSLMLTYNALSENLQDFKVGLMFYEITVNFREVREDIVHAFERNMVSEEKIQAWRQVVLLVRRQTSLVSSYLTLPQLMLLLQSIVLGTVAIFLALNAFSHNVAGTAELTSALFVWILVRVLVKATMAEKITAEEASIADELIRRNLRGTLSSEMQLMELMNLLMQSPTQINFANIVTLRKYVCLTVISQIVSYLIVLIQFCM